MNGITLREAQLLRAGLSELLGGLYPPSAPVAEADLGTIEGLLAELDGFVADLTGGAVLDIWTDGAARPTNPGPAGIGVIGKVSGRKVMEVAEHIGKTTNNVAEYLAAVTALRRAVDIGASRVHMHCDSRLVVNQFNGIYQCKDQSLMPLLGRMRGLAQRFDEFTVDWIPRALNREADGLSVAGAYATRACGACGHEFHTSFCLDTADSATEACGCPFGFRKGLEQ